MTFEKKKSISTGRHGNTIFVFDCFKDRRMTQQRLMVDYDCITSGSDSLPWCFSTAIGRFSVVRTLRRGEGHAAAARSSTSNEKKEKNNRRLRKNGRSFASLGIKNHTTPLFFHETKHCGRLRKTAWTHTGVYFIVLSMLRFRSVPYGPLGESSRKTRFTTVDKYYVLHDGKSPTTRPHSDV